jgi:hypothetical protein
MVPTGLVGRTSRAAARLAEGSTLSATLPAPLVKVAEGVLKSMLFAKLASKQFLLAAALVASTTAAVSVIASAPAGHRARSATAAPGHSHSQSDEWSWIDGLKNADAITRERLKRCASAANASFAAIRALRFEFDLMCEFRHVDQSGKSATVLAETYRGRLFWKNGSVRYDFEGRYPAFAPRENDPSGAKFQFLEDARRTYSVIRTGETLAHTDEDVTWGTCLKVERAPTPETRDRPEALYPLKELDPSESYAGPIRAESKQLRMLWNVWSTIESEEHGGKLLLRFLRADNGGRVEVTCDPAQGDLPVRVRAGDVRDGKWLIFGEYITLWKNFDGVWYPSHYRHVGYMGEEMKPVVEYDLTVKNPHANAAAAVPDAVFTLSNMQIPDGAPGFDNSNSPARGLIKAGGIVRESRPGELPRPKPIGARGGP